MSFNIHYSPLALAILADTAFLVLLPSICHWFCQCRKFVSLKWIFFFFLCSLLSMAACLRTPVKRWACQAVCHISNSVPLPFPELCCFVPGSEACVCKAQRPSLSLLGRSICPGSSYVVLDGENGWIAKWKHGRKPHDLCTCFRLEGSMGQEPAFESACLELGWA